MAKRKGPKPPLFKYHHSIVWKHTLNISPVKVRAQKRQMQWNGDDIPAPPQEMHLIRMKGNSGDELQQN